MRLIHLHLPKLTHYTHAAAIQDRLVRSFLSHKASTSLSTPAPDPAILTAEFHPVYTTGRRDYEQISRSQIEYLQRPNPDAGGQKAAFHPALRGGQTTYHGPAQLTAYAILDLKRHGLSPRGYIHGVLEESVIRACAEYGVEGFRTENPGVWTRGAGEGNEEKICAVGVHLRRFVSSHGIGLNVGVEPVGWLGRVVACGLEGKGASSLEGIKGSTIPRGVEAAAAVFVSKFAECLGGIDQVQDITEEAMPD